MKQKLSFLTLFILTFLITSWTSQEDDWRSKVDVEVLDIVENGGETDFLVYMKQQADVSSAKLLTTKLEKGQFVYTQLSELARSTQASVKATLETHQAEYRAYWVINAIWSKGDVALVRTLAQHADVQLIVYNPSVKIEEPVEMNFDETIGERSAVEWGLQMINADDVWDRGYTGQGVIIGGQDTGYDWEHPALKAKYRGWNGTTADHDYNWHDAIHQQDTNTVAGNPCGFDVVFPCDDNTHGTHTMGTMVGDDGSGNQIGVAPDARWVACRNMEEGWGTPVSYIECFEWFIAPTDIAGNNPDPAQAPHVFANSWSCPESEGCNSSNFDVMEAVVDNVKNSGIVVVVSTGNSGNQCSTVNTPAAMYESSFSVGATRSNDSIANFSSRGPVIVDSSGRMKPDISAPGVNVRSSILGDDYASFSGTSMAGPHVAGVVALLISAKPDLAGNVDMIEEILEQSATARIINQTCGNVPGTQIPNNTYGHGRIDALAAVNLALGITNTSGVETEQLYIYPNPFDGQFMIDFSNTIQKEATLQLYNAAGQLVDEQHWNTGQRHTISTTKLPTGVYFYHIQYDGKTENGKVVKR